MNNNLATQLRNGTSKSHSMAENVSFVKSFLGGVIDKNSYRKLLSNLYFIYLTLEEEIEKHKDNELIKPIYFSELNRQKTLEKDLEYYYGIEWKSLIAMSKATQQYVDRIKTVSEQKPLLLIAHSYTRYLGDLSGGQLLKKITQRALNLTSTEGLAFYEFKGIKDEKQFKHNYKDALDSLKLDPDAIIQIVSEANIAFSMNMKMFQELDTNLLRIVVKLIVNVISSFLQIQKFI